MRGANPSSVTRPRPRFTSYEPHLLDGRTFCFFFLKGIVLSLVTLFHIISVAPVIFCVIFLDSLHFYLPFGALRLMSCAAWFSFCRYQGLNNNADAVTRVPRLKRCRMEEYLSKSLATGCTWLRAVLFEWLTVFRYAGIRVVDVYWTNASTKTSDGGTHSQYTKDAGLGDLLSFCSAEFRSVPFTCDGYINFWMSGTTSACIPSLQVSAPDTNKIIKSGPVKIPAQPQTFEWK